MSVIYAAYFAKTVTKEEIKALFQVYGEITSIAIRKNKRRFEKSCLVEMADEKCAIAAINGLNGIVFQNNVLRVSKARPPIIDKSKNLPQNLPNPKSANLTSTNSQVGLSAEPQTESSTNSRSNKRKELLALVNAYAGQRLEGEIIEIRIRKAVVQCKELHYTVQINASDCIEGDLLPKATVSFFLDLDAQKKNLVGVKAKSSKRYIPPDKGCFVYLTSEKPTAYQKESLLSAFQSNLPAMICFKGSGIILKEIMQQILMEACEAKKEEVFQLADLRSELRLGNEFIWPELNEKLRTTFVAIQTKNKDSFASIKRSLCEVFGETIMCAEKKEWTVLIDESGSCDDYLPQRKNSPMASIVMAIVIPPNTELPKVSYGFHSLYPSCQDEMIRLRQRLLENDQIMIIVLKYVSGGPPLDHLGKGHVGRDFHLLLWRHLIHLTMEKIASTTATSYPDKNYSVNFYLENVGQFGISHSNVFNGDMANLVTSLNQREGWKSLSVPSIRIVPKDFHPLLGYADAIGFVFRPSPRSQNPLSEELFSRQNTYYSLYHQEVLQAYDVILLDSCARPSSALLSVSKFGSNYIKIYRPFLESVALSCLTRLSLQEKRELIRTLSENLSHYPDRYIATDFIISLCPSDFLDLISDPVIKAMAWLNQLASSNHSGDSESKAIQEMIEKLKSLMETMVPSTGGSSLKNLSMKTREIYWRYHSVLGDHYSNLLRVKEGVQLLESQIGEIRPYLADSTTALYVLGELGVLQAINGDTKKALDIFLEIYDYQEEPSDKERQLIYQSHVYMDKGEFSTAVACLRKCVVEGERGGLIEACKVSPYLLHAVFKLQVYESWLTPDEVGQLLDIHPGYGFPWGNIAYWRLQILKVNQCNQMDENWRKSLTENLNPKNGNCPALRLITGCLADQFRKESVALPSELANVSIQQYAQTDHAVQNWLSHHPLQPMQPRGYLAPLYFNFK